MCEQFGCHCFCPFNKQNVKRKSMAFLRHNKELCTEQTVALKSEELNRGSYSSFAGLKQKPPTLLKLRMRKCQGQSTAEPLHAYGFPFLESQHLGEPLWVLLLGIALSSPSAEPGKLLFNRKIGITTIQRMPRIPRQRPTFYPEGFADPHLYWERMFTQHHFL